MPLNPTTIWILVGVALCLMEIFVPTAFIEFTMGVSAIVVGLLAFAIPNVGLQVLLWMVLSLTLTFLARRFLPKRRSRTIEDAREAQTTTAIAPGQTGRVLYEGNSWQARCSDQQMAIAANQNVIVVGRQGTTLIVVPETFLLEKPSDEHHS